MVEIYDEIRDEIWERDGKREREMVDEINFINYLTLFTTSFPRDDMIKLDEMRNDMINNYLNYLSYNLPSYDYQSDLAAMRGVILSCWERWSIITTSSWSLVICLSLLWRFLPSLIGWIDPCFLTHEYLTRWDKMRWNEMMGW